MTLFKVRFNQTAPPIYRVELKISDFAARRLDVLLSESSIQDVIIFLFTKAFENNVFFTDEEFLAFDIQKSIKNKAEIAENIIVLLSLTRLLSDIPLINDLTSSDFNKQITDQYTTQDLLKITVGYIRNFVDFSNSSDQRLLNFLKNQQNAIALTDDNIFKLQRAIADSSLALENISLVLNIIRDFSENLSVLDKFAFASNKSEDENVTFSDEILVLIVTQVLLSNETLIDQVIKIILDKIEKNEVVLSESTSKTLHKLFSELLKIEEVLNLIVSQTKSDESNALENSILLFDKNIKLLSLTEDLTSFIVEKKEIDQAVVVEAISKILISSRIFENVSDIEDVFSILFGYLEENAVAVDETLNIVSVFERIFEDQSVALETANVDLQTAKDVVKNLDIVSLIEEIISTKDISKAETNSLDVLETISKNTSTSDVELLDLEDQNLLNTIKQFNFITNVDDSGEYFYQSYVKEEYFAEEYVGQKEFF